MWDELKIVHEKPEITQSQCSIEKANVENMFATWLINNKTKKWNKGLKCI